MRYVFILTFTLIGFWLAYGYPFWALLRGKSLFRVMMVTWAAMFIFFSLLCMGIPLLVSLIDHDFAKEMMNSWVPEGPAVAGAFLMGWSPAVVAAIPAFLTRLVMKKYWPQNFARLQVKVANDSATPASSFE